MHLVVEDTSTTWLLIHSREAIGQFVNDASSAGIEVGIQFFGTSCDPKGYQTPRVPIAPLPANAAALIDALPDSSGADTAAALPALKGAQNYAREWARDNPDADVVVVIITTEVDNDEACGSTLEALMSAQQDGRLIQPSVRTFFIVNGAFGLFSTVAEPWANDTRLVTPGQTTELLTALKEVRSRACMQ